MKNSSRYTFYETQQFRKWWFILLILCSYGIALYGFIRQVFFGIPFGNKPADNLSFSIIMAGITFLYVFLFSIRLQTKINEDGIHVRFFPFHLNYKTYKWKEISLVEVIKYNPLAEYGGWGLRYGKSGKAYTISGKFGIKIVFLNHSNLLIGTQKAGEVEKILNQIQKLN